MSKLVVKAVLVAALTPIAPILRILKFGSLATSSTKSLFDTNVDVRDSLTIGGVFGIAGMRFSEVKETSRRSNRGHR